jgi:FkbM family methyltransferase
MLKLWKRGLLMFEKVALKPLERLLFALRSIKGFRRLDFIFTHRILASRRIIFTVRILGKKIKLASNPSDDLFSLMRSNSFRNWEPGSLKLWTEICERSSTVVDVGAYSGIYSILAEKMGVQNLISIEPNPNSRVRLEKNFSLNKISSFTIYNCPLGDVTGLKLGLYVPASRYSNSGKQLESSGARFLSSEHEVVIIDAEEWHRIDSQSTIKLDDLIPTGNQIDAMKIDAEGMEIEVLMGATQILIRHHPELIIETWSLEKTAELNQLLMDFGYCEGKIIDDSEFNKSASNLYFKHSSKI